jgi:hypothetical protein
MNYRLDWSIQDGKLGADTGRIIMFDDDINGKMPIEKECE